MIAAFGLYLLAHAALYVAVLRRLEWLRRERGMFLYHAVPAGAAALVALGVMAEQPALGVLLLGVLGIYSLSFLEAWSLAQGGYSIRILDAFAEAQDAGERVDLRPLHALGAEKRAARLDGLEGLGLIATEAGTVRLTARGRVAAQGLHGLARLVNTGAGV